MQAGLGALSAAEREALRRFLEETDGTLSYEATRGAFAAFASMPAMVPPSQWFKVVLGDYDFSDEAKARAMIGGLMQLYNEVLRQIESGDAKLCPAPEDMAGVAQWASGYLVGARLDDDFPDETTKPLLSALGWLAEPELRPDASEAERRAAASSLADVAASLYAYLRPKRMRMAQALQARRVMQAGGPARPKVGRNELCPCGSGKKFKRCCAH